MIQQVLAAAIVGLSAGHVHETEARILAGTIEYHTRKRGVDPVLVVALMHQENRHFQRTRVGAAGERGRMQVKRDDKTTTRGYAHLADEALANDPVNVFLGVRLLHHYLDACRGDVEAALTAYNAGPGKKRVGRAPRHCRTSRYAREVLATAEEIRATWGAGPRVQIAARTRKETE